MTTTHRTLHPSLTEVDVEVVMPDYDEYGDLTLQVVDAWTCKVEDLPSKNPAGAVLRCYIPGTKTVVHI